MSAAIIARLAAAVQRRAAHRRGAIVQALAGLGVTAAIEGEAVRLSGHGLARRWMRELPLREAGRGRE